MPLLFLYLLTGLLGAGLYVIHRKTLKKTDRLLKENTAQLKVAIEGARYFTPSSSIHLVVSIGKCGSSTLAASLRNAFHPQPIRHVHVISEEGLKLAARMWLQPSIPDHPSVLGHLREAMLARMDIEERRERYGRPIGYYICGVREPVALAVSAYFQGFDSNQPIDDFSLDQARQNILDGPVLNSSGIYLGGLDAWFDREITGGLGVNVFQHPFDHQKGYCVINVQGVRVLVIRQENFQSLAQALADLYRAPKELFEVSDANRSQDKAFSSTYREAVAQVKFSSDQVDKLYDNRYVRHFYSDLEIAGFKTKWRA